MMVDSVLRSMPCSDESVTKVFFNYGFCLFAGSFLTLLGVNSLEHLGNKLGFGARYDRENINVFVLSAPVSAQIDTIHLDIRILAAMQRTITPVFDVDIGFLVQFTDGRGRNLAADYILVKLYNFLGHGLLSPFECLVSQLYSTR